MRNGAVPQVEIRQFCVIEMLKRPHAVAREAEREQQQYQAGLA